MSEGEGKEGGMRRERRGEERRETGRMKIVEENINRKTRSFIHPFIHPSIHSFIRSFIHQHRRGSVSSSPQQQRPSTVKCSMECDC
jgi:hypothetical protein